MHRNALLELCTFKTRTVPQHFGLPDITLTMSEMYMPIKY